MAAKMERERAHEPTPAAPVVEEAQGSPTVAEARDSLEDAGDEWWNDGDAINARGTELGVRIVAGQDFPEFTARVFAAAGPGPWLDEADAELLAKVEHYQAVGVNPPVAASTRYEPVPAGR